MNERLIVPEVAVVVAAKNHQPTILNPDFLKYSDIVPVEWKLQSAPISTTSAAQVTFENGISIVAEGNRVMFMEAIEGKEATAILVPAIARKYAQTLPNVEYQAMGLNLRGHILCDSEPDGARKYIAETLLSPGAWQAEGMAPMRATLNLAYTLERGTFYLSVNEAALRSEDETTTPIVLFSGNFSYEIVGNTGAERLQSLYQAIENWQADLKIYSDMINTKFLVKVAENKAVVPDVVPNLFSMSASSAA